MIGVSTAFANRIQNDVSRVAGHVSIPLPDHIKLRKYVLENAEESAKTPDDELKAKWNDAQEKLLKLSRELEARTEEIKAKLDPGVATMWGDAHLGLIEYIIKFADKDNGSQIADYILKGVPTYGEFPKTCLFAEMTEEQKRHYENKRNAAKKKFVAKEKTKIPDWVSKDDLKEAFNVFLKKAKNPVERFEEYKDLKSPVFCFPVKQGDRQYIKEEKRWHYAKIRPCMDYRCYNCLSWVSNKMSYGGQELVIRCCLKYLALEPDYRLVSRKQVDKNVKDEIKAKNEQNGDETCVRQLKKVVPVAKSEPRTFAVAKTDFANYYYWFPAREEYDVVICDGEKYRTFRIGHASFGSLQAIFVATVFSEALCFFINKILHLCASVYIDDIILVEPVGTIPDALSLLLLLFSLIRLPVQKDKVETLLPSLSNLSPEEAFRVLGLQFSILKDPLQLVVSVPDVRKNSIIQETKLAIELIAEGALTLQIIQSVTGQLISALFFLRHAFVFSKMRPLFVASCERRFSSIIKSKPFRALLVDTLKAMVNLIQRAQPMRFVSCSKEKKVAVAYTDASLEPNERGTKTAVLAGLFFFAEANGELSQQIRFPFSYVIEDAEFDISVYEAIALLIAIDRFPKKMLSFFRIAVGVDNTNTLFALAKAMSKNLVLSAATSIMLETMHEGISFFFVPSKQNIADVLTRTERTGEIDESLFVETVRSRIQDVEPYLKKIGRRVAEIRASYAFENSAKRRKLQ